MSLRLLSPTDTWSDHAPINSFCQTLLALLLTVCALAPAYAATDIEDNEYVVFYHHDVLGSPKAATDEKGRIIWREHGTPYGRTLGRRGSGGEPFNDTSSESGDNRPGYTGHTLDTGSGLIYMKGRYYDPSIGRFLSNDPVGTDPSQPASFNRYAYANNNPYVFVDPDGQSPDTVVDIGFAAYDTGRALGAVAAWAQGKLTGNQTLSGMAGEGFASAGADALTSAGAILVPGLSVGMVRGVKKAADLTPGNKAVERTSRTTRAGKPGVRITREDGTVIDITEERVKEYVPATHPNAPPGTLNAKRFDNPIPGSKGKKRLPTEEEKKELNSNSNNNGSSSNETSK